MRRVADRLGVGTMSLYRYVLGKAELLDVMVDQVAARSSDLIDVLLGGWRARLERVARENRRLYESTPVAVAGLPRPAPAGPGIMAKYDHELRAVEGIGLSDVEMDSVLTLVLGYVRGWAAGAFEAARAAEHTGQTDDQWWSDLRTPDGRCLRPWTLPAGSPRRIRTTQHYQGAYDAQHDFEFGLERLLDGVEVLVEEASRG